VLLLVRHGETQANRRGQYLGRGDSELTSRGMAQIAALADVLPRPDVVVSSPLGRARRTAEALSASIEIDQRWIELDYGPLDQQPVGQVPADLADRWRRDAAFAPPGVETLSALSARVHEACDDLVARAQTSVVIVVTHVGPIKAALTWALGVPVTVADRLFVEDAGISRIDFDGDRRSVRWFNRFGQQSGQGIEESGGGLAPRG
jgi:broad specificity phosphatase PhoE